MITSQEWLDKNCPNKEETQKILFNSYMKKNESFSGSDLLITDFPNLEEIRFFSLPTSKCEIRNCPKLWKIIIQNARMEEFVADDLPNLTHLDLKKNNLTSLDISKYPKLRELNCDGNSDLQPPLQSLTQKIQTKERELASIREKENQTKITNLEQELHSLKDLKTRLETQAQQKEEELTTELNQIKQEKENLEAEIKELHKTDFQKCKALENQQEEIKQLQSKITLSEQQKNSYQEKFNNSLQFIKDIRKNLAQGEEWKSKSS